jgi:hypothetical protein
MTAEKGAGPKAHVKWAGGGEARVVSVDAQAIVLRSTVPSPPGSRLEGALVGDPPAKLRVKVHGSKKQPEGDFVLEGRPLDLPRELRERLERMVSEARTMARSQ